MHQLCIGNAQNLVSSSEASWVSSQTHCQCLLEAINPNKSLHKSLAINQSIVSVICTNSSLSRTFVLGSSQKQWGADRFRVVDGNFRVFDEIASCVFFDRIYDRLRLSVETFASSSRGSPFTEPTASLPKNCSKKFGSDTWADASPASREEVDIELQLPELKETLCLLKKQWASEKVPRRCVGSVFLVGTGPGDPELLTLKALRLMQTADLVLYDRLVSTEILDMVHAGARLLYVGKTSGYHSRTQEEIHQLLLSFAEAGATVVRLKGGDPLVFGRGGEEMDFLQAQGIRVNIVPGITAASGIAAELGIPLTHRGAANSVRFLTGHSRKGGTDPLHVAEQAADPDSTLVIYMGLQTLPGLAAKLMANGLASDTPAAAVERGTTSQQRTVFAYLKDLPSEVQSEHLVSPTLIIIGQVVMLSPFWPSKISLGDGNNKNRTNKCVSNQQPRDRSFRDSDPALPSQLLT